MANINLTETNFSHEIIHDSEIKKVSYLTYLAAFIIGTLLPIAGLASPQIAEHFRINVSHVVYIDVLTLLGLILGNIVSGKIIERVGGKKTLALSGLILLIAEFAIAIQNSLLIYASCVLLAGLGIGLMVPAASYLIVGAFQKQNKSDAKLNVLNFFFGIGSFAGPLAGGNIIHVLGWRYGFALTGILSLILFLAAYFIKVNEVIGAQKDTARTQNNQANKPKVVTMGVFIVGLGLIAYVYTEYIISYWFSPYLQMDLNYNVAVVGTVISAFWLAVAIGRLVFGEFVLPRVASFKFIIVMASLTLAGFVLFLIFNNIVAIFLCTILLGLGCASIFPTMLGYGMQLNTVNPLTTAYLIGCGSVGGAVSLFVSGSVGEHLTKRAAIYMGPVCCILIIVFVSIAHLYEKRK